MTSYRIRENPFTRHCIADNELQYLTSFLGGFNNGVNDYLAATLDYHFPSRAYAETPAFRKTDPGQSTDIQVQLAFEFEDGTGPLLGGSAKWNTVMQISMPTRSITGSHNLWTSVAEQKRGLCGVVGNLTNNHSLVGSGFTSAEFQNVFANKFLAMEVEVAGEQYPVPGLMSARDCSELLKDFTYIDPTHDGFRFDNQYPILSESLAYPQVLDLNSGTELEDVNGVVQAAEDTVGIHVKGSPLDRVGIFANNTESSTQFLIPDRHSCQYRQKYY